MTHDVTTLDGRPLRIRPATPGDSPGVRAFFARQRPDSIYARFFSPRPRLGDGEVARLVAHGPMAVSLVGEACVDGAPVIVALAGVVAVPEEHSAEIGVAIDDAWQNVGLGTLIVMLALREAVQRGWRRFHAEVLGTNVRMLGLLREITPARRVHFAGGVARVEFEVDETADRSAVPAGA